MFNALIIILSSSVINHIRGGMLDKWLPKGRNDDIAAIMYGVLAGLVFNDIWLALGFAAAFRIGEAPAWGHWVGVAIGDHRIRREKSPIDRLLRNIKSVDVWAFAGLTIRGALWGAVMAIPAYFADPIMIPVYIAGGATMGLIYTATRFIPVLTGTRWTISEYIFGAALGLPFVFALFL
jgi:hypothetical protein